MGAVSAPGSEFSGTGNVHYLRPPAPQRDDGLMAELSRIRTLIAEISEESQALSAALEQRR